MIPQGDLTKHNKDYLVHQLEVAREQEQFWMAEHDRRWPVEKVLAVGAAALAVGVGVGMMLERRKRS